MSTKYHNEALWLHVSSCEMSKGKGGPQLLKAKPPEACLVKSSGGDKYLHRVVPSQISTLDIEPLGRQFS